MATNTTNTFTNHTGNGTEVNFSISFTYISKTDIDVTVGGVLKTQGTHYTVNGQQITFTSGNTPANGAAIKIQRDTNISVKTVDFQDGSVLTEADLDSNTNQTLFAQQEITDKLAGIEEGATADQTAAEIRTLTESASDSNVFTDADHSKLNAIEAGATADQTASEIRTLVESASDSNVFTDADHSKLNGIESGATADQTNAEIRAAVEAASDSNVFTDADHTKLNGIETAATADQTGAEIKSAYEGESNTNAFTDAEKTKLSGIATGADVTSSNSINALTDVNTAGAADGKILKYQASSSSFIIADDGGGGGGGGSSTFTGLSDTPANFGSAAGKTLKVNSGGNAIEFVTVAGSDVVDDTTPQLGGNLDVQAREINTSTTNGNIKVTPNGTGLFEVKGNTNAGTLQLNCENNSHGIKLKSPAHSAAASYTLTFPNNVVNGQFLKTDTNGNLSWAAVDLTALSASNLTSGTIPDARFPATLPAVSGANLTNLPASNYNIQINTISSYSGTGGNSATFNGAAYRFVLSNAGANAQAHLVSINGVVQKPNSGTSQPSEGFAIDGTSIIFSSAPPSGADFFILTLGTAINVGTPSDNTVSAAKLTSGAVTNASINNDSIHGDKLQTDTISEAKLDIHAAPSGTDKVLGYTANGMEWVTAAAGATGGGTDKIFYENGQTVTTNYTITNNTNAMSAGPVTINSGVAVTIGTGENWTIV